MLSLIVCVAVCSALIWVMRYWILRPAMPVDNLNEFFGKEPEKKEAKPRTSYTERMAEINKEKGPPKPFLDEMDDYLLQQKRRLTRMNKVRRELFPRKGRSTGETEHSEMDMDMEGYSVEQKRRIVEKNKLRRQLFPQKGPSVEFQN